MAPAAAVAAMATTVEGAKAGAAAADPGADGRKSRRPAVGTAARHVAVPAAVAAASASGGTETPETGTPPPRSLSPSSDSDTSVTPSGQRREGGANPISDIAVVTSAIIEDADGDDCTAAAGAIDFAVSGAVGDDVGIAATTTDCDTAAQEAAEVATNVPAPAHEAVVAETTASPASDGSAQRRRPEAEEEQVEDNNAALLNSLSLEPYRRPSATAPAGDGTEEQDLLHAEGARDGNKEPSARTTSVGAAAVDPPASPTTGGATASRRKASGSGGSVSDVGGAAAPIESMAAATRAVSTPAAAPSDVNPSNAKPPQGARGSSVLTTTKRKMAIPALPGSGQNGCFSDHRIIEVLAAHESAHKRLMWTAKRVLEILLDPAEPKLCQSCELYGSLALDLFDSDADSGRHWHQWASYYVNSRSDVDFVVGLRKEAKPMDVAMRLLKGSWRSVGEVRIHKFSSTQYTLLGCFKEGGDDTEVYLDVTCIESQLHFSRFKQRQEAFREVFADVRHHMEVQFVAFGALAFDAYVHLLKAFAAMIPGNALTGFQATCIGLFTLQNGFFSLKPTQSIALSLFEGFLRFCSVFFSNATQPLWHNFRFFSIDLSCGGRWMPRLDSRWRSELYFMVCETKMDTRPHERVNVLHSLDPMRVSTEARALLKTAFMSVLEWGRVLYTFPGIAGVMH